MKWKNKENLEFLLSNIILVNMNVDNSVYTKQGAQITD